MICINFNPYLTGEDNLFYKRERPLDSIPHILQVPANIWRWNETKTEKYERVRVIKLITFCTVLSCSH